MGERGVLSHLKQFAVGKPIPSHLADHKRLSRVTGLAVLSSDPLSSVAYATEEILRVLAIAGANETRTPPVCAANTVSRDALD